LLTVLVAASTTAAVAQISVNISIAPPALQYEAVPVMAPGYVWAPGYWAWHSDRYIWIRGRTIAQRTGYRWEPDRWEQRGTTYYQQPGRWAPDTNYKVVEVKKVKKPKHWNNGHGNGNDKGKDKPGKGPKQDNR
jgi:hypothetical protein